MENAKIEQFKYDILSNFQTIGGWVVTNYTEPNVKAGYEFFFGWQSLNEGGHEMELFTHRLPWLTLARELQNRAAAYLMCRNGIEIDKYFQRICIGTKIFVQ